jgi:hypothetical protein
MALQAPTKVLQTHIDKKQWLEGIVVSTAFFESFGVTKLRVHFKGEIKEEKLERLGLEEIIILLRASGIINQPTYSKMMNIKDVRNKLVHDPTMTYKLEYTKSKKLLEEAIECIKELGCK